MAELPSGTVTFLFTDIEGSTTRWEQAPEAMRVALIRHDVQLRTAIQEHGGHVVKTTGDGIHAAFSRAPDAVLAALDAQRRLQREPWGELGPIRVRMAIHTGAAEERDGDYYGPPLNRAARLLSAGHGGQILLSEVVAGLVRETLPDGVGLRDLGRHRLRDLAEPERVSQVVAPDLPSNFPPLASLDARPHNLPTHPTALLGREHELTEVRKLFEDGARLVTLTGPGGTGKTRLGLQVTADLLDDFEHGVFLVELAPISDPALVAPTIAQTLGVRDVGNRPIVDALKEHLRGRSALLLLDNFEQVLPAAPVVADLLAACPGLALLATSREPLRLRGEHEYAVPPLALPDAREAATAEGVSQSPAVALFVQRARAVRADFALTDENAPAVAEVCARLDGLPLAIELAAARVRLLAPDAMARRLERRLPMLVGGARDLPARQQALRDTIAWSHDLLDERERRLFRRLCVFVGGWTLDAAEAACNADGDLDVLGGLESLVSKSLVRHDADARGEPRFGMLETIREYAREQLDAGDEASTIHRRHLCHFLALAEAAQAEMRGPQQAAWLGRLEADHANFRAALHWASSHDLPGGLRLGVALWWFWWVRGHPDEGRHWLETLLAAISLDDAAVAARGSRYDGPSLMLARARQGAGLLTRSLGDYGRAAALIEQSLADFRALGDGGGAAVCLGHLAWMAADQGERSRAAALLEHGAVLAHADTVDEHDRAFALQWLGAAARVLGDVERATALFEESLDLSRRQQDRLSVAQNLQWLGSVALRRGDHRRAIELLTESLTQQQALGDRPGAAWSLHLLGRVFFDQGHTERASGLHLESLALHRDTGEHTGVAASLRGLARAAHARGDARSAARLFGAARGHEVATSPGSPPTAPGEDDELSDLRKSLGDEAFDLAWAEGRAMSLEQAVAYALDEQSPA